MLPVRTAVSRIMDREERKTARLLLPKHDPEVLRLNGFAPQETLFRRRPIWDNLGEIGPLFGAGNLKIVDIHAGYRIHTCGATDLQHRKHGGIFQRMVLFTARQHPLCNRRPATADRTAVIPPARHHALASPPARRNYPPHGTRRGPHSLLKRRHPDLQPYRLPTHPLR